jgi:hypothetical protein
MRKQQAPTLFKQPNWKKSHISPRSAVACLFMVPMAGMIILLAKAMTDVGTTSGTQLHVEQQGQVPASIAEKVNKGDGQKDMNGSLPLAKSLLNTPAPFQESDILRLSPDMTTSPNTVVTAYFRVPSKFKPGKYDGWMKNSLSLQDHMVIFTQPEMVEQVKMLRHHALDRTVIIQMKLDDLPIGTVFPTDFWQDQLERDPEKGAHKSYQLFWIWLSKSWCVTEAIRLNFFQSDLFVWSDIGCFRDGSYNSKTMILHRDQVPPHEMMQMAHHKPNPPKEDLFNDKYKRKPNFYHSGSQFAAYKDTWKVFHEYFLDTIDRFLERGMIIVEDQAVLQSVCLSHPDICVYVPFTEVKDNHYFGLRYVLHNGGEFKLWRHTEAIEAKKKQV